MRTWLGIAVALIVMQATPAAALCIYRGVNNARTTLAQEFRDAPSVVRVRVLSGDYHWSDEGGSWTLYRLQVVESYKGTLPRQFTFFTARNSGGFYMDGDGAVPDLGGEYLLFLVPHLRRSTNPPAARQAMWVNYNCGQSRRWNEVGVADRRQLQALRRRR